MRRLINTIILIFVILNLNLYAGLDFSIEVFENSHNILLLINPDSAEIIDASLGAKEFYKYPHLIGMKISKINKLSESEVMEEIAKARREERSYFRFKHELVDGKVSDVEVISYPLELDNKTVLLSSIRDVTGEHKTAHLYKVFQKGLLFVFVTLTAVALYMFFKVEISNKRYKELFENMNEGFAVHEMIYDKSGKPHDYKYIAINPKFEKMTGLKKDYTIGKTVRQLLPHIEEHWIDNFGNVAKTGEPLAFDNYSEDFDKYFDCYAFSPGKDKFAVVFTDITEKKKADEALQKYKDLQLNLTNSIIISLTGLLEQHDPYTKNHSENVAELSRKLAKTLELPKERVVRTYYAGLVHDIGKTIIPGHILRKTGRLSDDEFSYIKEHPVIGFRALNKSGSLKDIAEIVFYHHEKWDGSGYPRRLSGEAIPLESRILTIVDAYDAMVSDRPYREARTKEYAITELKRNAGTQFDPELVKLFIEIIS